MMTNDQFEQEIINSVLSDLSLVTGIQFSNALGFNLKLIVQGLMKQSDLMGFTTAELIDFVNRKSTVYTSLLSSGNANVDYARLQHITNLYQSIINMIQSEDPDWITTQLKRKA